MPVESQGTGRVDYSQNAEYVTIPVIRSHQTRLAINIQPVTLYSYDIGYVFSTYLRQVATEPYIVNVADITLEAPGDNMCYLYLVNYQNGVLVGEIGGIFGYGKVTLKFTSGYVWNPANGYDIAVWWNVVMDNPYPSLPKGWPPDTYTAKWTMHGFRETVGG